MRKFRKLGYRNRNRSHFNLFFSSILWSFHHLFSVFELPSAERLNQKLPLRMCVMFASATEKYSTGSDFAHHKKNSILDAPSICVPQPSVRRSQFSEAAAAAKHATCLSFSFTFLCTATNTSKHSMSAAMCGAFTCASTFLTFGQSCIPHHSEHRPMALVPHTDGHID